MTQRLVAPRFQPVAVSSLRKRALQVPFMGMILEAVKGMRDDVMRRRSTWGKFTRSVVLGATIAKEMAGLLTAVPYGLHAWLLYEGLKTEALTNRHAARFPSLPKGPFSPSRVLLFLASLVSLLRCHWLIRMFRWEATSQLHVQPFMVSRQRRTKVRLIPDVRYGAAPRNILDIYIPDTVTPHSRAGSAQSSPATTGTSPSTPRSCPVDARGPGAAGGGVPVLLFVHGGVWASGEKWQYAPLALCCAREGALVLLVQYTLYPQAQSLEQAAEVSTALTWAMDNVGRYGGDPHRIFLSGHSSGGHICCMAMWQRLNGRLRSLLASSGAAEASKAERPLAAATPGFSGGVEAPSVSGRTTGGPWGPDRVMTAAWAPQLTAAAPVAADYEKSGTPSEDAGSGREAADATAGAGERAHPEAPRRRSLWGAAPAVQLGVGFEDFRQPHCFLGLSGVFDIAQHLDHETWRGVEALSCMLRANGGTSANLAPYSPAVLFAALSLLRGGAAATRGESASLDSAAGPVPECNDAGARAGAAPRREGRCDPGNSSCRASDTVYSGRSEASTAASKVLAGQRSRAALEVRRRMNRQQLGQHAPAALEWLVRSALDRRGADVLPPSTAAAVEPGRLISGCDDLPGVSRAERREQLRQRLVMLVLGEDADTDVSSTLLQVFTATAPEDPSAGASSLPSLPPALLLCSPGDVVVPPDTSLSLARAWRHMGAPAEALVYDNVDHGSFACWWADWEGSSAPAHVRDFVDVVTGRVDLELELQEDGGS